MRIVDQESFVLTMVLIVLAMLITVMAVIKMPTKSVCVESTKVEHVR
jgi:hypothetical protein